jgi:aryl-alcohol dehydrogenase-like predicted oxidoreductase
MEQKNLGRSGLQVSAVGLGCNNFGWRCDQKQTVAVVDKALELGVTLFDTADIYGGGLSEEFLGKALGDRRKDVVVATKFAGPMSGSPRSRDTSRRHVLEAAEASLKRLGTDWIDLYQIHFPDALTPIGETLHALDDLVRQGKVRYVGCSNFAAWQVVEAQWITRTEHLSPLISAQNEYSLLERRIERELVTACTEYGLGILPYFPLASGFLTGKYRPDQPPPEGTRLGIGRMGERVLTEQNFNLLLQLEGFATTRGHSMLDLAIGWLVSQQHVASVIAGATKPEQVEQNVRAAEWRLTAGEVNELDAATGQHERR